MSSLQGTDRRDSWVTTVLDTSSSGSLGSLPRDGVDSVVAVSQSLLGQSGIEAPVGDIGVAMCFLPQDISLRAYAIAAVKTAAEHVGLEVLTRRNVPVRSSAKSQVAALPHVAQFFLRRPDVSDPEDFEQELQRLRGLIECEMVMMGLTDDDFRLVSCSSRAIVYAMPEGADDVTSLYPDLADASVNHGHATDVRRGLYRA